MSISRLSLAQILAKPRWNRDHAREVVEAWRRSGLSRRAFCERHDLDPQRLARWAAQLPERPVFAEVVVADTETTTPATIVVELGDARVVVAHDVDDDHLTRVLRIVGSVC